MSSLQYIITIVTNIFVFFKDCFIIVFIVSIQVQFALSFHNVIQERSQYQYQDIAFGHTLIYRS